VVKVLDRECDEEPNPPLIRATGLMWTDAACIEEFHLPTSIIGPEREDRRQLASCSLPDCSQLCSKPRENGLRVL